MDYAVFDKIDSVICLRRSGSGRKAGAHITGSIGGFYFPRFSRIARFENSTSRNGFLPKAIEMFLIVVHFSRLGYRFKSYRLSYWDPIVTGAGEAP